MSAFNRRFEERRLFGLPLALALGGVACGASAIFAIMLSGFLALMAAGLGLTAAVATALAVRYQSDLRFLPLILRDLRERGARMTEMGRSRS